jgi:predicted acetyltransferase
MAAMLCHARLEREYTSDGDFMARVLDVPALLAALRPELEQRVRSSGLRFAGRLQVVTDEGTATLAIDEERVALLPEATTRDETVVVKMAQSDLARLALGTFPPRELLARLRLSPADQATELLATLFPARNPHVYPIDRF